MRRCCRMPFLLFGIALAAQAQDGGFRWVGLQVGTLSGDTQQGLNATVGYGGQFGLVLDSGRYGFSLEMEQAKPKSTWAPGVTGKHGEASATFLSGLSGEAGSRWWPYAGLGLGALTLPEWSAPTLSYTTRTAAALHASVGLLHRSEGFLFWGAEGRYVVGLTKKDYSETRLTFSAGITWGGTRPTPQAQALAPAPEPPPAPVPPKPEPVTPPAPVAIPAQAPPTVPPPAPTQAPTPLPAAVPPPTVPPPVPGPAVLPAPAPKPKEVPPPVAAPDEASARNLRLEALRQGYVALALEQGRERIRVTASGHWTLRLEIANLPSTLKAAVEAYGTARPDLFIAPIKLRNGKTAYQLFLGDYASKVEADQAAQRVPAFFREGGQKPLPMPVAEIPSQVK